MNRFEDSDLRPGKTKFIGEPEYQALEQIVAEANAAGVPVVALGPAGIFEINPSLRRRIHSGGLMDHSN